MDPESIPELLVQFVNNEEVAAQVLAAVQQNPQAFLQMIQNAGGVTNQMLPQVPGVIAPAGRQLVRPALGTQTPMLSAPMFSASDREAIQRVGSCRLYLTHLALRLCLDHRHGILRAGRLRGLPGVRQERGGSLI
jgi:hypothetical protein